MSKTGQSRIDDSIDYIANQTQAPRLAGNILQVLRNSNVPVQTIGKELSLGSRSDNEDDPQYTGNTQRRHAEDGRVPNAYCNSCSLDAQFLNGYKHALACRRR